MTNEPMMNGFVTAGVNLQFHYAAGEAASRFLIALRDERKIYGTRCAECRRVLVPARSFCPRCFAETREWVEVGPSGTLVACADLTPQRPSLPSTPLRFVQDGKGAKARSPLLVVPALSTAKGEGQGERSVLALIRLDGADTALVHRIGETSAPCVGLRVIAVFAETRAGSILDIAYFKPLVEPQP